MSPITIFYELRLFTMKGYSVGNVVTQLPTLCRADYEGVDLTAIKPRSAWVDNVELVVIDKEYAVKCSDAVD